MSTTLEKIAAKPGEYSCQVDTLGPCTIMSPVRHHEFVPEGDRILMTESVPLRDWLRERLGHEPTFERAGPHEKIFHDPSWTRVASSRRADSALASTTSSRDSSRYSPLTMG